MGLAMGFEFTEIRDGMDMGKIRNLFVCQSGFSAQI